MAENITSTAAFFAGFLQFDVESGAPEKNLARVRDGLAEIAAVHSPVSPGIVVLPELWGTGFAYHQLVRLAGEVPGLLAQLQQLCAGYNILVAGSLPEGSGSSYYNTLYLTGPEGIIGTWRKQRLFSPMGEDDFFTAGTATAPVNSPLGPLAGLVCYDLRFPELLRQQAALGATLLVVSAQWPEARVNHWRVLLQARAIENQMFVVAANRSGTTDATVFGGHSMIIAPDGAILAEAGREEEFRGVLLDPEAIGAARSLFRTRPGE
jgi:predicted amidohydrolase